MLNRSSVIEMAAMNNFGIKKGYNKQMLTLVGSDDFLRLKETVLKIEEK